MAVTAATTVATLGNSVAVYYSKQLLDRLAPLLHLYKFGQDPMFLIASRMGTTGVWTKYTNFAASDVGELTDGTTPSAVSISSTRLSATVKQWGIWDAVSDWLDLVAIDPIIEDKANGIFADAMALKIDTLIQNELSGGTVQYARGKSALTDLATSDTLITTEIRNAVRKLERGNVLPHPLTPGFYPFFCHPDCKYDLLGDTNAGSFIDVRKYTESKGKDIEMNKIGDAYGAKGFVTSNIYSISSVQMTYSNLMFGKGAFGIVRIGNDKNGNNPPRIIVKQPGSAGALDPLEQQGSIGVKFNFISKLLDATRVIVMKASATYRD